MVFLKKFYLRYYPEENCRSLEITNNGRSITSVLKIEISYIKEAFMNNSMRWVIMILLLASTVFSSSLRTDPEIFDGYEHAAITARTEIWKKINSGEAGSGAIAIMEKGELVYFEGFGMANREQSSPVDEETVFNIASVSKVFTAAAVMRLVDKGQISLDETLSHYLPDLNTPDPRDRQITVRMLLNHTSGIAGSTMANACGYDYNQDINDEILENINHAYLIHEPGEVAVYCNDGFALAEMIVERLSGKSFKDFLAEEIFLPLKMENTGMTVEAKEKGTPAAFYSVSTGKSEPQEVVSSLGAGGLNSTVIDLCLFADCFSDEGNRLFSDPALGELRKYQPASLDFNLRNPVMSYGLGWDYTSMPEYEKEGIQVLGKSGESLNYSAMLFTIPELRLSVAVTLTGTNPEASLIAGDVLKQIFIEKGLINEPWENVPIPLKSEPFPEDYKAYEGYYAGNSGSLIQVKMDEENHIVNIYTFYEGELIPASSFFYNNGYLYQGSESDNQCYFITVDDQDYFLYSALGMDFLNMEKLKALDDPQNLNIDLDGMFWLRRNVRPYEHKDLQSTHIQESFLFDDLPGYCFFSSIQQITSDTSADFAAETMRDQKNLLLFESDDVIWARTSDMLYSPADDIALLEDTTASITIGTQGYNEWLMTDADAIFTFTIPSTGRVVIFSPEGSPIYDSIKDSSTVYLEEGCLLEFIGAPKDTFHLLSQRE